MSLFLVNELCWFLYICWWCLYFCNVKNVDLMHNFAFIIVVPLPYSFYNCTQRFGPQETWLLCCVFEFFYVICMLLVNLSLDSQLDFFCEKITQWQALNPSMGNEQGPLCEMFKRFLQHWPNNFIIYCLCHHILDIDL